MNKFVVKKIKIINVNILHFLNKIKNDIFFYLKTKQKKEEEN
jgi:hypothetical protein